MNTRSITAGVAAALTLTGAAWAQTAAPKLNIVQKHPTATGFVAGVATHSALKHSAAYKKAHGQKLSFAEKHPTLTGLAAGIGTRAVIKHSTPKVHQ